jgi:hypothetical protein
MAAHPAEFSEALSVNIGRLRAAPARLAPKFPDIALIRSEQSMSVRSRR